MSDTISAFYDSRDDYERLCRKYNEKPMTNNLGANPYSKHAKRLRKKEIKESKRNQ